MIPTRTVAAVALALASIPAVAQSAPTDVATSSGRLIYASDGGVVHKDVDAGSDAVPVALPDGALLLVGGSANRNTPLSVTRVTANGAIDRTFGEGGSTETAVRLNILQVLRQPDGRLLVIGVDRYGALRAPVPLKVVRLLPDGRLDTGFGAAGVATTAVGMGCGLCTTAALGPDGSIVLAGTTGTYPTNPTPTTVPDLHWSLTRLTPAGAVDSSFGDAGVATVPDVKASGFNVAVLPSGHVVTEGQTAELGNATILLARLTPAGAMDPAFNGGAPVRTPLFSGFPLLVRDDGSMIVAGSEVQGSTATLSTSSRRLVAAYTPTGSPDATFGSGGVVDLGTAAEAQQLLADPAGAVTVIATPVFSLVPGSATVSPGTFLVAHWGASGTADAAASFAPVRVAFGGGGSSFVVSIRPRPLPPLGQNSFRARQLVRRPDGSFLAVGGVAVTQPTGEGTGFSIGRTAIAAFTSGLVVDTSFGGAAAPLTAGISVPRQRARTAYERHGIRMRLQASAPGLWRVKVRTRDGRVLAQSVLPVFARGSRTLPVELTRTGNRWLRGHRGVRVVVAVTARDLFGVLATTTATGTLR